MLDIAFFILLTAVSALVDVIAYPRFCVAGRRATFYALGVAVQWTFVACVIALWLIYGRAWSALFLGPAPLWRHAVGAAIVAGCIALAMQQRRVILARPDVLQRLFKGTSQEALVPRTRSERRLFFLLSVTAGICEELLFRGYVFWFFARWTGAIAGVAIGSVLFGIGHAYLGWKHVIRTTKVGVLFSLITFATGSLWAGMIVHAIMDLLAGDLGFHAFNQPEPESATSLSPTQTSPA